MVQLMYDRSELQLMVKAKREREAFMMRGGEGKGREGGQWSSSPLGS